MDYWIPEERKAKHMANISLLRGLAARSVRLNSVWVFSVGGEVEHDTSEDEPAVRFKVSRS